MNSYLDSMNCEGFQGLPGGDTFPDVILSCTRSDIFDIRSFIVFAVEHSDDMNFISKGVHLYDALNKILQDHMDLVDPPK